MSETRILCLNLLDGRVFDATEPLAELLALTKTWSVDGDIPADQKARCREIGHHLNDLGGFDAMLAPGDFIVERNRRMARTVEWLWDGIGDWRY